MTDREFIVKAVTVAEKKYPRHRFQNIPQHPFTLMMVGTRGSGKTTILYNLITIAYRKYFHRVVILTPNLYQDNLYVKLHDDDLLDIKDMYTGFDEEVLTQIMEDQDHIKQQIDEIESENKNRNKDDKIKVPKLPRVLIIIDDSGPDLRESIPLKKIHCLGRHKSISIITMVQKYTSMNTTCRANLNDLIITRPSNMKEIKTISEDKAIPHLERIIISNNARNDHSFAYIDKHDKLHLNFGKLIES